MTILFCSCDKYKDLWDPFFTIFKDQWNDCQYEILINTESETYHFEGLDIRTLSLYKKGERVPYGKRMIDHITAIRTKYTMIVLDDFFLRDKVNESIIDTILNYMDKNTNIECIRLTPYQHRETYDRCVPSKELPGFYHVSKCSEYKLNFQVCIWRTDRLLGYWREDDDPWRWEVFANITSFDSSGFMVVGEEVGPILDYGYKVNGQPLSDVYRGKWVMENNLVGLFEEHGLSVDFSLRGAYKKEEEPKHFYNIQTIRYVVKRIGLGNTITLFNFILNNKIKAIFHLDHHMLSEYPIAFAKKNSRNP